MTYGANDLPRAMSLAPGVPVNRSRQHGQQSPVSQAWNGASEPWLLLAANQPPWPTLKTPRLVVATQVAQADGHRPWPEICWSGLRAYALGPALGRVGRIDNPASRRRMALQQGRPGGVTWGWAQVDSSDPACHRDWTYVHFEAFSGLNGVEKGKPELGRQGPRRLQQLHRQWQPQQNSSWQGFPVHHRIWNAAVDMQRCL
jgi:hypothetical protein